MIKWLKNLFRKKVYDVDPLDLDARFLKKLNKTDQNILSHALKDPATLHPSVALSVGIETEAMRLRHRADGMMERFKTVEELMEFTERVDGGTAPVDGRIAKTDEEYHNRILPSTKITEKDGKTEAQIDAWNSLMQNGGRVMYMGKGKTYVEVNERRDPKPVIDVGLQKPLLAEGEDIEEEKTSDSGRSAGSGSESEDPRD